MYLYEDMKKIIPRETLTRHQLTLKAQSTNITRL